jgi:TRAP-type C4-dicarboxylate transport system permease small subunit
MNLIPHELLAIMGALLVVTLWCTWAIRSDWRTPDGQVDWWELIESFAGMFFLLCMLVSSALQVLVRYFVSDDVDMPWTEEFARLAMIWAAFWGAAALQRRDDHIRMSAIYDLLPVSAQKAVRIMGDLVILAILVPIVWLGWETARSLDIMHSISLGFPLSIFAYPVPIGGVLMMFHTLVIMVARLRGKEPPPAPLMQDV